VKERTEPAFPFNFADHVVSSTVKKVKKTRGETNNGSQPLKKKDGKKLEIENPQVGKEERRVRPGGRFRYAKKRGGVGGGGVRLTRP